MVRRLAVGMLMTSAILKRRGVCSGWRKTFRRKFPTGQVRITRAECEKRAQAWPWDTMANKLLNAAGKTEYDLAISLLLDVKVTSPYNWMPTASPISSRALKVVKASIFGHLAEQSRYDPAYTP